MSNFQTFYQNEVVPKLRKDLGLGAMEVPRISKITRDEADQIIMRQREYQR